MMPPRPPITRQEFKLVSGANAPALTEEVNKLLADHWELYGFPFSFDKYYINQALVRTVRPATTNNLGMPR